MFTQPQSILDIGIGFGKYGFLSREYLELWDGREGYNEWKVRIDGIEAYEGYITPMHRYVYNNIYIGNAIDILLDLNTAYDLILLIDVLEHFEYDQGTALLNRCERTAKNMVIATPRDIGNQIKVFDNPFEMHKYQWKEKDFCSFRRKCFIANKLSLICYIGEEARRLKKARINRKVGKWFPFLIPPTKLLKSFLKT